MSIPGTPMARTASFSNKHEIRISKSETNLKFKCSKFKTKASLYDPFRFEMMYRTREDPTTVNRVRQPAAYNLSRTFSNLHSHNCLNRFNVLAVTLLWIFSQILLMQHTFDQPFFP